jgi:hypothetical protein
VNTIFSTGYAFCAVKNDGSVYSWGFTSYDGSSISTPIGLTNVKTVYSTSYAFAVLKNDGSVIAFGDASKGGSSPVGLTNVVKIFSTTDAFCALKKPDGVVVCWGNGINGGSVPNGLSNVKTLFSTSYAFAAVKNDGLVTTWGSSSYDGSSISTPIGLTNVKTLFSNSFAFATVKDDGSITAWGQSNFGGIAPLGLTDAKTIFGTDRGFACLKNDGSVTSWGYTDNGGNAPSGLSDVKTIYGSTLYRAISSSPHFYNSCAIGTYSSTGYPSEAIPDCTACSAGYSTATAGTIGTDASVCSVCAQGYYSSTGNSSGTNTGCTACNAGYSTATAGTIGTSESVCNVCAQGYYSGNGITGCTVCPTGYSTATVGTIGTDTSVCNVCAVGYSDSSDGGVTVCDTCSIGFYKDTIGNVACTQCEGNSMSSAGASICYTPTGVPSGQPTMVPSGQPTGNPTFKTTQIKTFPIFDYSNSFAGLSFDGAAKLTNLGANDGRKFYLSTFIWPSGFGKVAEEYVTFYQSDGTTAFKSIQGGTGGSCFPRWNQKVGNTEECITIFSPCAFNLDVTELIQPEEGGSLEIKFKSTGVDNNLPTICAKGGYGKMVVQYEIGVDMSAPTPEPTLAPSFAAGSDSMFCQNGKYFQRCPNPFQGQGPPFDNMECKYTLECMQCDMGKYSNYNGGKGISRTVKDCQLCPAGKYSNENGATSDDVCKSNEPGSYSPAGSSVAIECNLGEYQPDGDASSCKTCPAGKTTGLPGSKSEDDCKSNYTNFVLGFLVLPLVVLFGYHYVVEARFDRVAFMRDQRSLKQVTIDTHDIISYILYYDIKAEAEKFVTIRCRRLITWMFIILYTIPVLMLSSVFYFIAELSEVLFKSLLIYKSLQVDLIQFNKQVQHFVSSIFDAIGLNVIIKPFVAVFEYLAKFKIDLDVVGVTCTGARAPFELSANMIIIGLTIVLILGSFQVYKTAL